MLGERFPEGVVMRIGIAVRVAKGILHGLHRGRERPVGVLVAIEDDLAVVTARTAAALWLTKEEQVLGKREDGGRDSGSAEELAAREFHGRFPRRKS
jgi:hypothetical protein